MNLTTEMCRSTRSPSNRHQQGCARFLAPDFQSALALSLVAGGQVTPAAVSLTLFAWLPTLHPTAADRVYAAYGAVYVSVALVWLRIVEGVPLTFRDLVGSVVVLAGMGILMGGGQRG